ncbi:cyclic-di-GMP phosphodiesterase TipF (flagellum assembly factor) [Azospirillum fermentarium]|uniref:EAL domain-containing protein n=1 Tax=Azospirillum fermentarium TaxID=1233114 RepID=UPI0022273E1F|nr:EAL domain-containing protein [Azospirillum fermentarium]MCW2245366.1 cyclic-di-GMP phosphodiesterase TipF (flagellum assembly factor) [Azospirillum fermentarium]
MPRKSAAVTLVHVVYVLAYTTAAVAVGMAVPLLWPESALPVAVLAGAVVFLAGALLHEVVARRAAGRRARRRLTHLAAAATALHDEVLDLRARLDRLESAPAAPAAASAPGYDTVVQEVKLLQTLVGRLYTARTGEASAPPAAAVPAVAAPSQPLDDAGVLEAVRDALRADRIDVYLQPVVSLPQRKHRGYEVFTRVRSAEGAQIMPDRYLDIAEREGLIATIDNLLLIRCVQLIRETERRQHHITFFNNISSATLGDAEFMQDFLYLMQSNPSLVPKLIFELGQEDLRSGPATTLAVLGQVARLGFRFSLDQIVDPDAVDVETLAAAEFRFLKLDAGLLLAPATVDAAWSLLQRCRRHGIDVILEKIETEQQLAALTELGEGIDFGQGYLFGEPRLSRKPG